jgi:hypothetical protein
MRCSVASAYSVRSSPLYGKSTPKKFDNVPTEDLDSQDPSQLIVLKKRFKLIVTTTLAGFKVLLHVLIFLTQINCVCGALPPTPLWLACLKNLLSLDFFGK